MRYRVLSVFCVIFFSGTVAYAGWLDALKQLVPASVAQTTLSETQIGKGLKAALSAGIDKAVQSASREGGYLDNEAIRIRFPENLSMVETGLRKIGMGSKIDAFELSVNRAAEKAAPEAKSILLDALMDISIEDARKLLEGGETAATDYFRSKSWDNLYRAFEPRLAETMSRYQASQRYDQLIAMYQKIPFAQKPALVGADEYATTKALDGLFLLVAEQEKKIRTDPSARATELLKTVFGQAG